MHGMKFPARLQKSASDVTHQLHKCRALVLLVLFLILDGFVFDYEDDDEDDEVSPRWVEIHSATSR